jgi:hypothetical protein
VQGAVVYACDAFHLAQVFAHVTLGDWRFDVAAEVRHAVLDAELHMAAIIDQRRIGVDPALDVIEDVDVGARGWGLCVCHVCLLRVGGLNGRD